MRILNALASNYFMVMFFEFSKTELSTYVLLFRVRFVRKRQ